MIGHASRSRGWLTTCLAVALVLVTSCSGSASLASDEQQAAPSPTSTAVAQQDPSTGTDDEGTATDPAPPAPEVTKPDPVPYVPAGRVGDAQTYRSLIAELEAAIPPELQSEVPWPDLGNANPIVAQVEIFELWIWMAANHPEPALVEVMAAPLSPSREEIVSIFGLQDRLNQLETRNAPGYQAFEHLVVTFESAGLPLWLARDVPEDAVVVYYSDNSGPTEITDRDTGELLQVVPPTSTRTWLSIMVPTDIGWQLWRDQLIEPSDAELEVPDVPPPSGDDEERPAVEVY